MSPDRAYLDDIVFSARLAMSYVGEMTLDEFMLDIKTQDAVIRRIEVIGEAAGWVSAAAREVMPEVPWARIKSMRNFMIHEYWDVDEEVVWSTVRQDLPALLSAIERHLP